MDNFLASQMSNLLTQASYCDMTSNHFASHHLTFRSMTAIYLIFLICVDQLGCCKSVWPQKIFSALQSSVCIWIIIANLICRLLSSKIFENRKNKKDFENIPPPLHLILLPQKVNWLDGLSDNLSYNCKSCLHDKKYHLRWR